MANILIIDDDVVMTELLSQAIKERGQHDVVCTNTLGEGLAAVKSGIFAVVYLDVCLPDGNGLDAISELRNGLSSPEVIIMTGAGDPDGAELAIKSGAWDYLEKPSSINMMILPLVRALQYRDVKLSPKPLMTLKRQGIVGGSPSIMACLERVAHAAGYDASVLITGETGTGKEGFAWAIHENSRRADKNFVVVDCATLSDTLVESVLFGYQKGAFTGADRSREGLIKQADGGTLFLDEIGELPLAVQKAFLRVLQERRFRPLGGKEELRSDFRLVAATNRDLDRMVLDGQFRSDLLYRIRSFTIELPPLREHPDDIPALVTYHVSRLAERHGDKMINFSPRISRCPEGIPLARQCPRTDQRPGAGSGRGGHRCHRVPQGPSLPHPGADGPLRDRRQRRLHQSRLLCRPATGISRSFRISGTKRSPGSKSSTSGI